MNFWDNTIRYFWREESLVVLTSGVVEEEVALEVLDGPQDFSLEPGEEPNSIADLEGRD